MPPATDPMTHQVDAAPRPNDTQTTPQARHVPAWALHRRLYDWVLSLAHKKHSTTALFCLSFAESSVFPIPPDVLQIALTLERRERAWFYATVSTIASVLGAVLGYLIGWAFWHATSGFFFEYVFSEQSFNHVTELYKRWDFWIVFIAAFTPIPYKVITIAGGVCGIGFPMFILASIIGRAGRFYAVAALLYLCGPSVKVLIDRYFNLACVVFTVLLVGGFMLIKVLASH